MKIAWSPLALDRVAEIADYIARENVSAAKSWIDAPHLDIIDISQIQTTGIG